jgi:hypothetical protein
MSSSNANTVYTCTYGKMRPIEIIPGIEEERIKNDGGAEFNNDIFDIL